MTKPIASLSLDLDDLWSYQRTHGDPAWEQRGSYLSVLMPPLLDLLDEAGCRITFFVVGADAATEANRRWLQMITDRGHEVGNHSFHHECWLHLYSRSQLEEELVRAEEAICAATSQRPVGFRGPGFSWSPLLLEVLAERGYAYDASTLPTYLAPLARAYFLATARMSAEERRQRRELFGSFRDGFRPVGAYHWRLTSGRRLLEIPVTTIPVIKTPFHMSYLIYLSRFSHRLMDAYLRSALVACRRMGITPSFLLHPLDVLGPDQAPRLAFFPGMDVPSADKRALVRQVLATIGRDFTPVSMSAHAAQALAGSLPLVQPSRGEQADLRPGGRAVLAGMPAPRAVRGTTGPTVTTEPPA